MKQYLIPFLVGVALIACGIVTFQIGKAGGYQRGYNEALNLPHKPDTVWKVDTHFVYQPVEVVKWKDRERLVYVKVDSLVTVHDTTYVAMEREFKKYTGDHYEAQVSGVAPALDWIKVFPKTAYISNTVVQKKKWSFGVTAGPGAFFNGKDVQFGVGAVVGFGYNF